MSDEAPGALEPLAAHLTRLGAPAEEIRADYLAVVTNAITNHPRSLQTRIGPSELGHPCARRIGYKLAGTPEANHQPDVPWLPTVGTAVHGWFEEQFVVDNCSGDLSDQAARWLVEQRVSVGEVGGVEVTGSADLYDRVTGTVIDHKIVGPTPLKKYKSQGPGAQYRAQAHLYGRGFIRRGLPVARVMVAFLPRNGELRDAHFWSEPYDEQVALDALQRAEGIALTVQALGAAAPALLPTADAYCQRCPWFRRAGQRPTDLASGCPGDESATPDRARDQILSLI